MCARTEYRVMVRFFGDAIPHEMCRMESRKEAERILFWWGHRAQGVDECYLEKREIGDWEVWTGGEG